MQGQRVLDLGRRLERAQFVVTGALGPFAQSPIDWEAAMWVALELCDSTITYRTRYLGQLQPAPVLDLVMLDDSNPRSLAFQLRAIEGHLDYLARVSGVRVAALPGVASVREQRQLVLDTYRGLVDNTGLMFAQQGDITMAGHTVVQDGIMLSTNLKDPKNNKYLESKEKFGDVQLHVEFATPVPAVGTTYTKFDSE